MARVWSQEASRRLQPKGGGSTARGLLCPPRCADPLPWQQGQSLQKRSRFAFSEVVPLEKLLHMSFKSIMDENTAESSIGHRMSVLGHIFRLFGMLLNWSKAVMLMKTG